MSREWRIVVETEAAKGVEQALRSAKTRLDVERDGDRVYCYVDAPHDPERVRKRVLHRLALCDLAEAVPDPLPIERWHEEHFCYLDPSAAAEHDPPAVEADEIGWAVAVKPSTPFELRQLREELRLRRRTEIGETEWAVEAGARDEADARALADELRRLPAAGSVAVRRLGWLGRWRVRERLLGNYMPPRDPTQPPLP
jgi:hypothetical protein